MGGHGVPVEKYENIEHAVRVSGARYPRVPQPARVPGLYRMRVRSFDRKTVARHAFWRVRAHIIFYNGEFDPGSG